MAERTVAEVLDGELVDQRNELVPLPPRDALTTFGDATVGIDRARAVANMLKGIVQEKHLAVNIQGREHLMVEAWCACASMVGVAPMTEWAREVRHPVSGELEGYEARVQVVQIATGIAVGAAEAGCFYEEEQWSKKEQRMVPRWTDRHAVKSMAQTRATSKAIGQVLRWIPVLAGFSGTPYEEMPPGGHPDRDEAPPPRREPQRRTQAPPPPRDESADPKAQAFLFMPGDPQPPDPKFKLWGRDAPTRNPASEYANTTWDEMAKGSFGGKRYQWCRYVLSQPDAPASTRERARITCWLIENREHNKRADMAAANADKEVF